MPSGTPSKNRINTEYSKHSEDFFKKIKNILIRLYINIKKVVDFCVECME